MWTLHSSSNPKYLSKKIRSWGWMSLNSEEMCWECWGVHICCMNIVNSGIFPKILYTIKLKSTFRDSSHKNALRKCGPHEHIYFQSQPTVMIRHQGAHVSSSAAYQCTTGSSVQGNRGMICMINTVCRCSNALYTSMHANTHKGIRKESNNSLGQILSSYSVILSSLKRPSNRPITTP